jgi:hypothetical protein
MRLNHNEVISRFHEQAMVDGYKGCPLNFDGDIERKPEVLHKILRPAIYTRWLENQGATPASLPYFNHLQPPCKKVPYEPPAQLSIPKAIQGVHKE